MGQSSEKDSAVHMIPYKTLVIVWISLLAGTGITILASLVDMGKLNVWAALAIASCKASLVLFYFMNLRNESSTLRWLFLMTVSIVALFIGMTFFDVSFR